jgi:hypothetical protein
MDETTRTAVSVAEMPAEAPRLRYDRWAGSRTGGAELNQTNRKRIVGMLILGGYLTYCVGNCDRHGPSRASPDYLSSVSTSTPVHG